MTEYVVSKEGQKLMLPMLPNYILHYESGMGSKTHISDLSDETLQRIGMEFTQGLIAKAQKCREEKQ